MIFKKGFISISAAILTMTMATAPFCEAAGIDITNDSNYTDFNKTILSIMDIIYKTNVNTDNALKSDTAPMFTLLDEEFTLENAAKTYEIAKSEGMTSMTYAVTYETLQNSSSLNLSKDYYNKNGEPDVQAQFIMRGLPCEYTSQRSMEIGIKKYLSFMRNHYYIDYEYVLFPGTAPSGAKEAAENYLKGMCNNGNERDYNFGPEGGRYNINRLIIDKSTNIDSVKTSIDRIAANGGWIVFSVNSNDLENWDADKITQCLQYAMNKGLKDMSLGEAVTYRDHIYKLYEMFS